LENLNDHADVLYSQDGEDGILKEILRRLDIDKGTCIEFGAGDGREISNTYQLWHNEGWDALLIEPHSEKFESLQSFLKKNEADWTGGVVAKKCFVTHEGPDTLDSILDRTHAQYEEFDFESIDVLSIDIDGNDYHVWKAFETRKAKCVVIEYRTEFPPHISHHDPPGQHMGLGASARALTDLAEEKGYTLVSLTRSNAFFVDSDLMEKMGDVVTSLEELHDPSWCTYVIGEFSGRRCWLSRQHPPHYYFTQDRNERRAMPKRELYPVHMHEADGALLRGRFRILNNIIQTYPMEYDYYKDVHGMGLCVPYDLGHMFHESMEIWSEAAPRLEVKNMTCDCGAIHTRASWDAADKNN